MNFLTFQKKKIYYPDKMIRKEYHVLQINPNIDYFKILTIEPFINATNKSPSNKHSFIGKLLWELVGLVLL